MILHMRHPSENVTLTPEELRQLGFDKVVNLVGTLSNEVIQLRQELSWFKRQIFGQKSEKRIIESSPHQGTLGEDFDAIPDELPEIKKKRIPSHERKEPLKNAASDNNEPALFFDESKVPVQIINVANPAIEGLAVDQYEVIGQKVTHRLAQRPGSYVILKYVRPVVKLNDNKVIHCAPAPVGVIEGSRADVSFLAGMLVDKVVYHKPLYRQHQNVQSCGIDVSRAWLTQLAQQSSSLIEPIFEALLESVKESRVLAMDETPIKAGQAGPGKMKTGYYWPIYGEKDEIVFNYYPSRSGKHVIEALGLNRPEGSVLLTDGYAAYSKYAEITGILNAQCWSHTRRYFERARDIEPNASDEALDMIGQLYQTEARIREKGLTGQEKRSYRQTHAKPVVEKFFKWVNKQFEAQGLLPSSPLLKAAHYARERREGLQIYLEDSEVPIDTNHLERLLRVVPMGRKNWLFNWTELGAKNIGMLQSLVVTCRLHDIDPYTYLVDVLQRVGQHPAKLIHQLIPRVWKELFVSNPLTSDLLP